MISARPLVSIAITTFERANMVSTAVQSALTFVASLHGEVIVVDDASTDGTAARLRQAFAEQISDGRLVLVAHEHNGGVTAAKNTGYLTAQGNWVLFLDSDDALLIDSAPDVETVLNSHPDTALVFFRCIDQTGRFVGQAFDTPQDLTLHRYLQHTSYGEALVAINKRLVPESPFDADLRGYEGLGCARIIKRCQTALLSTVVARCYDQSGNDRLSSSVGFLRRAKLIGRGHLRLIATFWSDMSVSTLVSLAAKAFVYLVVGAAFSAMERRHD